MAADAVQPAFIDTFFARQPIFDPEQRVWGYTLLYRHGPEADAASYSDEDVATLTTLAGALADPEWTRNSGRKVLLHFSREAVLQGIPAALPARTTVVEVAACPAEDREFRQALAQLRKDGYLVALDRLDADTPRDLLHYLDLAFVDVLGPGSQDLAALVKGVRGSGCALAGKRVETTGHLDLARKLGCTLFQGYFFQRPELVSGRRLTSSFASRTTVFELLNRGEAALDKLCLVISADVSLSFRLMSFINSPAFGFTRRIDSIRQAVLLLGWRPLKGWLWLTVLSDVAPRGKTSELPHLAAIRARFLERVAEAHQGLRLNGETLFLLGLFSLLDALLDRPMPELADALPLTPEVKATLCGEDNAFAPWLALAACFEQGDWDCVDSLAARLRLEPLAVARAYAEAVLWAGAFFGQDAG